MSNIPELCAYKNSSLVGPPLTNLTLLSNPFKNCLTKYTLPSSEVQLDTFVTTPVVVLLPFLTAHEIMYAHSNPFAIDTVSISQVANSPLWTIVVDLGFLGVSLGIALNMS